ncbi:MAG: FliO/MopB family protein [Myxococcales bacterium]|nr:FliO/MopB family protein [Myxococcales bacterium]MCB9644539.1 FliO/MopB family protein [Myxococcales bacterium]
MRPSFFSFSFSLLVLCLLLASPLAFASPPTSRAAQPSTTQPASTSTHAAHHKKATSQPASTSTVASRSPRAPGLIARLRLSGPQSKPPPIFDPSRTAGLVQGQTLYWMQAFSVLFILGAIIVFIFLVLRWASARAGIPLQSGQQLLQVHARMTLEPKKALWLVGTAQQYFLIASHEQGVTFLANLDPKQTQAALAEKPPQSGSFWSLLRKAPETQKDADSPQAADPIPTHFEVVSDGRKQSQDQTKS